ncbi:MAG: DUF493 domain-containing protein [Kiritimatiellaeota bacterium]|nr:DUF493 domain-containing protein [Kiritimatiellota bacterium]
MIQQKNDPQQGGLSGELKYPAQFHFRIIADSGVDIRPGLAQVVSAYQVTTPLAPSHVSPEGRYAAYAVSILMQSRDEMETFDAAVRKIPGVHMLL